jgi:hypothetical protein
VWEGGPTFGFPAFKERFRYSADPSRAKYLVLGDIDTRWTIHQKNVLPTLEQVSNAKWPIVWSGQYYVIARNPTALDREEQDGQ